MSAKYFRSVLVQIEYPGGMANNGDANPTGAGITTPVTELTKIIADGCGANFTQERHEGRRGEYDAIFVITEV